MSLKEAWERMGDEFRSAWADISNIRNNWKNEDPRILWSVLAGLLAAGIWCIVTRRRAATREKQKQTAMQTGKVIKAKRVHIYRDCNTDKDTGTQTITYRGIYEYTVEGKTRRYRVHSKGGLPDVSLYLYYTDSPRKVFSDYDNPQLGYNLGLLLGIAVCLLTMYLTGYIL